MISVLETILFISTIAFVITLALCAGGMCVMTVLVLLHDLGGGKKE